MKHRTYFRSFDHETIAGARRYELLCEHGKTTLDVLESHDRAGAHGDILRRHIRDHGCRCILDLTSDPVVLGEMRAAFASGGREPGARVH